jgi:alpha-beta hydrolase superfamily lysophospholipase
VVLEASGMNRAVGLPGSPENENRATTLSTVSAARQVSIPSTGGISLFGRYWARPSPRAVVVISHGFGEYGGCYGHVIEALGPALHVDFLSPDLRGHGRSPGRRGVVRSYNDLIADLLFAFDWAGRERPGLPRFVLGHSNGGQLALHAALAPRIGSELAGLVLSNPALALATRVPRYKLSLARFLRRHAPGVTLSARVGADKLTRDPEMQRGHRSDHLRHARMSAPLFFGMVEGGQLIQERAPVITVPVLLLLGNADPVIDPGASRAFFARLGSTDRTIRVYEGLRHEPLNELGREQVLADIKAWLESHLPTA